MASDDSPIQLNIEGRVGRLLLRRQSAGNAFTSAMLRQFLEAMTRASTDADILVIASAGEDFSLGRDRQEPKSGAPFDAFKLITDVNAAVADFPGISVSVVSGRAFGFAVGMIMRTDISIAADDARFALDEVKLGIPPMFIMAGILDHLAPKSALDIVLSSREFTAQEAHEMGLLSRVVPAAYLRESADKLVGELRERDPAVLRVSKRYLGAVRQLPRDARGAYALVEQTRFAERMKH